MSLVLIASKKLWLEFLCKNESVRKHDAAVICKARKINAKKCIVRNFNYLTTRSEVLCATENYNYLCTKINEFLVDISEIIILLDKC